MNSNNTKNTSDTTKEIMKLFKPDNGREMTTMEDAQKPYRSNENEKEIIEKLNEMESFLVKLSEHVISNEESIVAVAITTREINDRLISIDEVQKRTNIMVLEGSQKLKGFADKYSLFELGKNRELSRLRIQDKSFSFIITGLLLALIIYIFYTFTVFGYNKFYSYFYTEKPPAQKVKIQP